MEKDLKKLSKYISMKSITDHGPPQYENYFRNMWFLLRKDNQEVYRQFDNDLRAFSLKVSSRIPQKYVNDLVDKKIIFLGNNLTESSSVFSGGCIVTDDNKMGGVVLDANFFKIDIYTGTTKSIDNCFYGIYFHFIRSGILTNSRSVRNDQNLHELCIKYYSSFILKILGKNVYLNDKERMFLDITTRYFFYRFILPNTHETAVKEALENQDKDIKDEVSDIIKSFKRYDKPKDVFKALVDFKLTNASSNMLMMTIITKFGPVVFHGITSNIDYLVALGITSKYAVSYLKGSFVSSTLQDKLEQHVQRNYLTKIKYDVRQIPSTSN